MNFLPCVVQIDHGRCDMVMGAFFQSGFAADAPAAADVFAAVKVHGEAGAVNGALLTEGIFGGSGQMGGNVGRIAGEDALPADIAGDEAVAGKIPLPRPAEVQVAVSRLHTVKRLVPNAGASFAKVALAVMNEICRNKGLVVPNALSSIVEIIAVASRQLDGAAVIPAVGGGIKRGKENALTVIFLPPEGYCQPAVMRAASVYAIEREAIISYGESTGLAGEAFPAIAKEPAQHPARGDGMIIAEGQGVAMPRCAADFAPRAPGTKPKSRRGCHLDGEDESR